MKDFKALGSARGLRFKGSRGMTYVCQLFISDKPTDIWVTFYRQNTAPGLCLKQEISLGENALRFEHTHDHSGYSYYLLKDYDETRAKDAQDQLIDAAAKLGGLSR
jgi:hypothetical protein